jgi:hypothetical protein
MTRAAKRRKMKTSSRYEIGVIMLQIVFVLYCIIVNC